MPPGTGLGAPTGVLGPYVDRNGGPSLRHGLASKLTGETAPLTGPSVAVSRNRLTRKANSSPGLFAASFGASPPPSVNSQVVRSPCTV